MMPINQVANVTLADAHTITVQPWEKKMVQVVEKALRDSDLGLNPATSGDVIRVPDAGADRGAAARPDQGRQERGRRTRRLAVRNVRRDAISHLKDLLKSKSLGR